jgi:hypothetical protein
MVIDTMNRFNTEPAGQGIERFRKIADPGAGCLGIFVRAGCLQLSMYIPNSKLIQIDDPIIDFFQLMIID